MPLKHGAGHMPVLGFGTPIPDAAATMSAARDALEAGFRHFDCAERYRNEREVGEALQAGLAAVGIAREDIFVTTKLVELQSSARAGQAGFRGESGQTRGQLSGPLSHSYSILHFNRGTSRIRGIKTAISQAVGLSDTSLNELLPIYESARIKPAVVQVEAHPYLPEKEILEFCKEKGVVFLANEVK
jgi:alcohol dehydrogenase (NADP+)